MQLAANAAGLWLAAALISGIAIDDWQSLVAGTAIFAIANTLIRPIATFVSCCLIAVTFGLFLVVVNAAMLALTAWAAGELGLNMRVDGFWSAAAGAIVISLVSLLARRVAVR
ncbi:MAG: phage holin family protein [Chloroflexi bacterium]|nr:phage holin family protein [Chloroflexota bacterium]